MPASNQHAAVKTTESTALSAWLRPIILRKRANSHRNWPPPVASVNAGMHDIAPRTHTSHVRPTLLLQPTAERLNLILLRCEAIIQQG